jgi:hypothetical protein
MADSDRNYTTGDAADFLKQNRKRLYDLIRPILEQYGGPGIQAQQEVIRAMPSKFSGRALENIKQWLINVGLALTMDETWRELHGQPPWREIKVLDQGRAGGQPEAEEDQP